MNLLLALVMIAQIGEDSNPMWMGNSHFEGRVHSETLSATDWIKGATIILGASEVHINIPRRDTEFETARERNVQYGLIYEHDSPKQDVRLRKVETTRSHSVIVASSGTVHKNADYICDGVDDQVEINAAIQQLQGVGGTVRLLEGTYYLSGAILMNVDGVVLSGQGIGSTILRRQTSGNAISIGNVNHAGVHDVRMATGGLLISSQSTNARIKDIKMDGAVNIGTDFTPTYLSALIENVTAEFFRSQQSNSGITLKNFYAFGESFTGNSFEFHVRSSDLRLIGCVGEKDYLFRSEGDNVHLEDCVSLNGGFGFNEGRNNVTVIRCKSYNASQDGFRFWPRAQGNLNPPIPAARNYRIIDSEAWYAARHGFNLGSTSDIEASYFTGRSTDEDYWADIKFIRSSAFHCGGTGFNNQGNIKDVSWIECISVGNVFGFRSGSRTTLWDASQTLLNSHLRYINCVAQDNTGIGIFIHGTRDSVIEGNYLDNNFYGMVINDGGTTSCSSFRHVKKNVHIVRNTVRWSNDFGIAVGSTENLYISDNVIEDITAANIYSATETGIPGYQGTGTTFILEFPAQRNAGIYYFQGRPSCGSQSVYITGNSVIRSGSHGILVHPRPETESKKLPGFVISNNKIFNVLGDGIFATNRTPGVTRYYYIHDNIVNNPGRNGITVYNDGSPPSSLFSNEYATIHNNHVYSPGKNALWINRLKDSVVRDNHLRADIIDGQTDYAIRASSEVVGSSTGTEDVFLIGNIIEGVWAGSVLTEAGASVQILNQYEIP